MNSASYRIVDPHVHVWVNDPAYPWAKEATGAPKEDATPDMLLDLMKANGVARTVLVQFIGYRWDNRYAASVLKKYPQYFRGVARVNPEDPVASSRPAAAAPVAAEAVAPVAASRPAPVGPSELPTHSVTPSSSRTRCASSPT